MWGQPTIRRPVIEIGTKGRRRRRVEPIEGMAAGEFVVSVIIKYDANVARTVSTRPADDVGVDKGYAVGYPAINTEVGVGVSRLIEADVGVYKDLIAGVACRGRRKIRITGNIDALSIVACREPEA